MKYIILVILILATIAFSLKKDAPELKKYKIEVLKSGTYSHYPKKGDQVIVNYVGTLLDGKKFDSSRDRNQPFVFNVGQGRVIQCWDEVVSNLTIGDHVSVTCPSQTAYGSRGAGQIIGPNADLIFDIEMISFESNSQSEL
ncbi:hypothetical protein IMG5_164010 [Ichthyophthirius multifiliis]|uniref:peptidylprolyl isomerase n=1 Tax=Ichthyophthirius multifiliis TaxID=5932 RepID=G0R0E7_ICHMU|nr:hypothetical protein IMG5_164010 [Ichthyophthirius multifiliis]EGR29056.1 hypothetical protein IMG5_164010 [Ichthyophthirius multifiliis]|eukprot:XP_004030292.1 hypothetical protein IMG5_164010 [Ichthyophthirius multifiliis]